MQPEASRRACVVKEPLSSYTGACRSTWVVTAEGQSSEAQPRADHDLFPSSGGAGLRAVRDGHSAERSPRPRSAALPRHLCPAPTAAGPGGIDPRTAASASSSSHLRSSKRPQAGTCWSARAFVDTRAIAQGHLQGFLGFCF